MTLAMDGSSQINAPADSQTVVVRISSEVGKLIEVLEEFKVRVIYNLEIHS